MKKIFTVLSVCVFAVIVVFVSTLCFVKTNMPLEIGNPYNINVFNHSTSSLKGKSFTEKDAEYKNILTQLNQITRVSIFNRLKDGGTLKPMIEQDLDGKFTKYSTDLKSSNIAVELIFNKEQDIIVYYNGDTRVISCVCLMYIIPDTNKLDEILVYYSHTADSTNQAKETAYAQSQPLVLYGYSSEFSKLINSL